MKRNFDLIRLLLIEVEGEEQVGLSEYTPDQINYHKALLIESGLVEGPRPHYSSRGGKILIEYLIVFIFTDSVGTVINFWIKSEIRQCGMK